MSHIRSGSEDLLEAIAHELRDRYYVTHLIRDARNRINHKKQSGYTTITGPAIVVSAEPHAWLGHGQVDILIVESNLWILKTFTEYRILELKNPNCFEEMYHVLENEFRLQRRKIAVVGTETHIRSQDSTD